METFGRTAFYISIHLLNFNKMKRIISLFVFAALTIQLSAQQDAMFTKYMFNPLVYNPAYAGSRDGLSLNLLHRHQWVGFEGAPLTQTFTAHAPISNNKMGLGGTLMYDQIGASKTFKLAGDYAYKIKVSKKGTLALGLNVSVMNFNRRLGATDYSPDQTPIIVQNNVDKWLPNFGFGAYYSTQHFYIGAGIPNLLTHDLHNAASTGVASVSQQYRHYFTTIGGAINITPCWVFRPSLMWKNVGMFMEKVGTSNVCVPNEIDLDVSFLYKKQLWLGAAFRTAIETRSSFDSFDFWLQYVFKNGLSVGAAYDYPLNSINRVNSGSYELMLGYDFGNSKDNIRSPRYF
jgi:type IX secretion system PorP/SprF family membrane protein